MFKQSLILDELSSLSKYVQQDIIITGESALLANKLIKGSYKMIINLDESNITKVNSENIVAISNYNNDLYSCVRVEENVFLPTAERAIVDYIIRYTDENKSVLLQAIKSYMTLCTIAGKSRLYKVADYYGVSHTIIDEYVDEAMGYSTRASSMSM